MENKDNLPSGKRIYKLEYPEPKVDENGFLYTYWWDRDKNVYWTKEKVKAPLDEAFYNDSLWDGVINKFEKE